MNFKKHKRVYSLPKAPVLRSVRTQYSVRYHVFTHKINEQLCSFSRQPNFNLIMVNYGRLKHWMRKGLSFHPKNLIETDAILWPRNLEPLRKRVLDTTPVREVKKVFNFNSKTAATIKKPKHQRQRQFTNKYKP